MRHGFTDVGLDATLEGDYFETLRVHRPMPSRDRHKDHPMGVYFWAVRQGMEFY
jgi:hypothetical protein